MNRIGYFILGMALIGTMGASECSEPTSDDVQQVQQETLLQEGTNQVGMPSIKNFRERKLMKDILEMRDQNGLVTYTYTFSEMSGRYTFFCNSIGYGLPYATQFTNPQKSVRVYQGAIALPQADPNGLFSPAAAEGTWVMCKDGNSDRTQPVYVEPRVIVSPFRLP